MPALFFAQAVAGQYNLEPREIATICFAVAVTIGILILYVAIRRKPPIEVEVDRKISRAISTEGKRIDRQLKGLRGEMLRLNDERRGNQQALFAKVDELRREIESKQQADRQTMQVVFNDLNRALGTVEGFLKLLNPGGAKSA